MITVIIPTWNLIKRGFRRLDHALYSLSIQSDDDFRVIVADGSDRDSRKMIYEVCEKYHNVQLMHRDQPQMMNMPKLYNQAAKFAIKQYESEYLFFTGADFVYGPEFIADLKRDASPDKLVFASTMMGSPSSGFNHTSIQQWHGDWNIRQNVEDKMKAVRNWGCWGEYAPGKQCMHRDVFLATNGFDEKFVGISAFDTDMAFRATEVYPAITGKPVEKQWTHRKDCWHIWHKPYKFEGEMGKTRHKNHLRFHALKEDWKKNREKYRADGFAAHDWKTRTI